MSIALTGIFLGVFFNAVVTFLQQPANKRARSDSSPVKAGVTIKYEFLR